MLRIILGIVAGLLAVFITVGMIEYVGHLLFPVRSDGNAIPPAVQVLVLAAYFLAALIGGWIAASVSGRSWTAWAVALVVVAGAIGSMFMVPHPQWMQVAAVLAPLFGGLVAAHLTRQVRPRVGVADGRGADAEV
jgi:hypothetical protein